jgi:hypothetical protein
LRTFLAASLAVVFLLLLSTGLGSTHEVLDRNPAALTPVKAAQVYGAYTLAFLVLVGALAVLLRLRRGGCQPVPRLDRTAAP